MKRVCDKFNAALALIVVTLTIENPNYSVKYWAVNLRHKLTLCR
ncbi:transposase [Vibrio crassostreae]|nr:transposase [Vibrio crassostreae]CAK2593546.1 transposase [Vibrio crassostreae]CAK3082069.1 transposase [Vibrio crassostreae]CAK3090189.1 transposase [Vibrio crassostreae]CAK3101295.1 transposase [Vibrio crassostreae]